MKNIIITNENLDSINSYLNEDTLLLINPDIDILLNNITSEIKYIGFLYHYEGFNQIPFFNDRNIDIKKENDKFYIYQTFIDLINKIKIKNENIIFDLLTCNITDDKFIEELNKLPSKFRYSTNEKGYKGDWIQESDNVSIKNIYFNNNIDEWKVTLSNAIILKNLNETQLNNYKLIKSTNNEKTIYTLTDDLEWISTDFFELSPNEIFNGNNKKINVNINNWNGLFVSTGTSESNRPIIENLEVNLISNSLNTAAGIIIIREQRFFIIDNCHSSGNISVDNSGGICGFNAGFKGNCSITNCYSLGNISGLNSGGICGLHAGSNGNCSITNCYSLGNISGNNSGGICGLRAGSDGNCSITNCHSSGNISGSGSGGICGFTAGASSGNCAITNCYSLGNILGSGSGGICGAYAGASAGNCSITNCYSLGNISGSGSGGICGVFAGFYGNCSITNCYSLGNISGIESGGICGNNVVNVSLTNSFSRSPYWFNSGNINSNILYDNQSNISIEKQLYEFIKDLWDANIWVFLENINSRLRNNFQISNLINADLTNADLTDADLTGADLTGADLTGANLTGVNLTNTILNGIKSSNITFNNTILPTNYNNINDYIIGPNVDLTGADLTGVNLTGADLTNTILNEIKSGNITFNNTNLPTNYNNINGYIIGPNVDLTDADLTGAVLNGIKSGNIISNENTKLPLGYKIIGGYIIGNNINLNENDKLNIIDNEIKISNNELMILNNNNLIDIINIVGNKDLFMVLLNQNKIIVDSGLIDDVPIKKGLWINTQLINENLQVDTDNYLYLLNIPEIEKTIIINEISFIIKKIGNDVYINNIIYNDPNIPILLNGLKFRIGSLLVEKINNNNKYNNDFTWFFIIGLIGCTGCKKNK